MKEQAEGRNANAINGDEAIPRRSVSDTIFRSRRVLLSKAAAF